MDKLEALEAMFDAVTLKLQAYAPRSVGASARSRLRSRRQAAARRTLKRPAQPRPAM